MIHLHKDLILDKEFAIELFLQWTESNYDYDYITWLKLITMHKCRGGASNIHINELKKTIIVLLNEINKQ